MVIKAPKAVSAADCKALEQLPNIGPSLAADLRLIGIREPRELRGKDAIVLYQKLCAATGQRQDPCVLDTFMAATDFMRGAPAAPCGCCAVAIRRRQARPWRPSGDPCRC
jgi:hypothetical protein